MNVSPLQQLFLSPYNQTIGGQCDSWDILENQTPFYRWNASCTFKLFVLAVYCEALLHGQTNILTLIMSNCDYTHMRQLEMLICFLCTMFVLDERIQKTFRRNEQWYNYRSWEWAQQNTLCTETVFRTITILNDHFMCGALPHQCKAPFTCRIIQDSKRQSY